MTPERLHALRYAAAITADLDRMAIEVRHLDVNREMNTFDVGDGRAIFLGHGLFVNRLVSFGLHEAVVPDHLDAFEARAWSLGHDAVVDESSHGDPQLGQLLAQRGYEESGSVSVLSQSPPLDGGQKQTTFRIESVVVATLDEWCEATAQGWGHVDPERRIGSDLYAHAAFAAQDPGLLLARSVDDRRVVGCAALAIVDEVAILGGMSTVPNERRSGVQAAFISERLQLAAEHDCSLTMTQAEEGSTSQRNLLRHGFTEVDRIVSWTKSQHA